MKNEILKAYEALAYGYNSRIDHKPHNAYYDRPNMMALIGDVSGKYLLDAACGPGKYAEELIAKNARVVGFDWSPKMIAFAQERNPGTHFFVHDLTEPLPMFKDAAFDMVVCALALHYIQHWEATLTEFNRVLKPGGRLVLSIEHPFFEYNYFRSTQYFEVEPVKCTWNGFGQPVEVPSYRRSLSDCINPLIASGFTIDHLLEPRPTKEFEALDPRHFKELNEFPAFMCVGCSKKYQ